MMAQHLFPKEFYFDEAILQKKKTNDFNNLKAKTVDLMEKKWQQLNQIQEIEHEKDQVYKILLDIEKIT